MSCDERSARPLLGSGGERDSRASGRCTEKWFTSSDVNASAQLRRAAHRLDRSIDRSPIDEASGNSGRDHPDAPRRLSNVVTSSCSSGRGRRRGAHLDELAALLFERDVDVDEARGRHGGREVVGARRARDSAGERGGGAQVLGQLRRIYSCRDGVRAQQRCMSTTVSLQWSCATRDEMVRTRRVAIIFIEYEPRRSRPRPRSRRGRPRAGCGRPRAAPAACRARG